MLAKKKRSREAPLKQSKISRLGREYVDAGLDLSASNVLFVLYDPVDQGEQSPVLADANILAGVDFGAQLANKDIPGQHFLAAETLYSAALARAVSTVSRASARFFMSHDLLLRRLGPKPGST
jgi:hypothetical protein